MHKNDDHASAARPPLGIGFCPSPANYFIMTISYRQSKKRYSVISYKPNHYISGDGRTYRPFTYYASAAIANTA